LEGQAGELLVARRQRGGLPRAAAAGDEPHRQTAPEGEIGGQLRPGLGEAELQEPMARSARERRLEPAATASSSGTAVSVRSRLSAPRGVMTVAKARGDGEGGLEVMRPRSTVAAVRLVANSRLSARPRRCTAATPRKIPTRWLRAFSGVASHLRLALIPNRFTSGRAAKARAAASLAAASILTRTARPSVPDDAKPLCISAAPALAVRRQAGCHGNPNLWRRLWPLRMRSPELRTGRMRR